MSDALERAVKMLDARAAFEREFPEAWAYWNDVDDYRDPYRLAWQAFNAGCAYGVKTCGGNDA